MAGDWIKMCCMLPENPKVTRIAEALRIDPLHVVGCLMAIWAWADSLTEDGVIRYATFDNIDRRVRVPGFASAMQSVGWLEAQDDGICFPRWERHNSRSAKARALSAERMRKHRRTSVALERNAGATPAQQERNIPLRSQRNASVTEAQQERNIPLRSQRNASATRAQQERNIPLRSQRNASVTRAQRERNGSATQEKRPRINWTPSGWSGITDEHREKWKAAYPACDIDRQLAAMDAWCMANPTKTKSNWERFIVNWLSRSQERGGDDGPSTHPRNNRPSAEGAGRKPTAAQAQSAREFPEDIDAMLSSVMSGRHRGQAGAVPPPRAVERGEDASAASGTAGR